MESFAKLELRIARILTADPFPAARKPAYKLSLNAGPHRPRLVSSAQLTKGYPDPNVLVGQLALVVCNFPVRKIAGFKSEALVTGMYANDCVRVYLVQPRGASQAIEDSLVGARVGLVDGKGAWVTREDRNSAGIEEMATFDDFLALKMKAKRSREHDQNKPESADEAGEDTAPVAKPDAEDDAGADESTKQTKLAYAMARILGDSIATDADQKVKRAKKEKPILSKHKSIEATIDDQKLEDKAKKLISKEKKMKALDVARIRPEDVVAANDLEKKLKKVATRGVVKLFNAIRVAQKSVEGVKADGIQKNNTKLPSLSQGGFMQMIKEPSTSKQSSKDSVSKTSSKLSKGESASGGGVPWIDDGFMMKESTGAGAKSWDMDSD
ncbi:hypothetical protein HDU77_003877 [Chytriomyces hyalinus]|nr:hypothetical protein HDU77_003877 [Chytriomyces hyalinus]